MKFPIKKYKFLFFLIFIFYFTYGFSQTFEEVVTHSFGHGILISQPFFYDIDNDNLMDLFVSDYSPNGYIRHFEQTNENSYNFQLISSQFNDLALYHPTEPFFIDIDNDMLLDMLVGVLYGNINHFEQIEINSYEFELINEYFNDIEDWRPSPILIDIDNDGLLNLITGKSNGCLSHYEQVSPNSYDFEFITGYFNNIDVGSVAKPTFTDIDGDNLIDLIIGEGEYYGGNIFYYEQVNPGLYDFVLISDNLLPVDVGRLTTPALVDIDNDNLLDFVVGESDGNLNLFEQPNIGSYEFAFNFITPSFITIDIGRFSFPACKDIDNDGLLDLIIGEEDGNLNLFEQQNIGSYEFEFVTDSFLNIGGNISKPTITDIDSDGLWDLFVRESSGDWISYYEQVEQGTYDFVLITENFLEVNYSTSKAMHFVDIDNDNLLDLLIGIHTGVLIHFEQESENSQVFNLISENFSDIYAGSYAVPTSTDLDNNGLLDLLIGVSHNGRIRHYEQEEINSYNFVLIEPMFEDIRLGYMAAPTLADINDDNLDDIVAGSLYGGIHLFEQYSDILYYFTKIETGDFVNEISSSLGCSCSDYDLDEDIDLFITNAWWGNPANPEANLLYANNGDGTFTQIMNGDIVNFTNSSNSSSWGDYNNDGFIDLFVANSGQTGGPNSLFQNNGDGTFITITDITFIEDQDFTQTGVWGDFNNNGFLDLITTSCMGTFLYMNLGGDTFSEKVILNEGYLNGINCVDYDNDNDLDLYLTRYTSTIGINSFLYNNNGDGTFFRVYDSVIVLGEMSSPGASWADYDNDNDLDLFIPSSEENLLYSNNGDGTFTQIFDSPIVTDEGNSRSSNWGDFDNDGDLDLFVINGEDESNFLYENIGNGNFERIIYGEIVYDIGRSMGCNWLDADNDGDLDLYVVNFHESNFFYQNQIGTDNNWIKIRCIGDISNKSAIGAKVKVKALINGTPVWQMREISGQSGAYSQNSLIRHFGLGNANSIDYIVVEWPSGIVQVLSDVDTNQLITITEPEESNIIFEIDNILSTFDRDVTVPIMLINNNYPINSIEITLDDYTNGLEYLDFDTENTIIDGSNWICTANEVNNTIQIVFAGSEPLQETGILCYLKFHVNEMEGFVPINFDLIVINTGEMLAESINGGVIVIIPDYGDVDMNGQVQAFDAVKILEYLVETYNLNDVQSFNAEVSFDNTVSALDANIIFQYVSGLIDSLPYETGEEYFAYGIIQMEDQTVSAGYMIEVPLYLSNAENIYSFEACIGYDSNMIEFISYEYNDILDEFIIENNFSVDNKLLFSGTGFSPINENGEFILFNFLISEEFISDSTIVSMDKLRWNENDIQFDSAETILFNSVSTSENILPKVTRLHGNFPNPFNPSAAGRSPATTITFSLAQSAVSDLNGSSFVNLEIYNIKGQKVKTLIYNEILPAGNHSAVWYGTDDTGKPVASGVYLCKLSADRKEQVKKMLLLK